MRTMKNKRALNARWFLPLLFIYVSVILALNVHAQEKTPVVFNEIKGVGGKPVGGIRGISQDPSGYMWFAGEEKKCIYRYDGIQMTVYQQDVTNPNSLGGTDPSVVLADDKGLIWVGFTGHGLDRFDPVTNTFTHYRHDEANKKSLADGAVMDVLRDKNGTLWVATTDGLDRFDEKIGEFIHYKNDPNNPRSLSCNFVSKLYEDSHGVLWVATAGFPWVSPDPTVGGLNRMEPDGGFKRYMNDPKDPNSLISNKVLSVFEDSRGVFWVGTGGDGLHTMDRQTGRFTRHLYDPKHPEKLSRSILTEDKTFRNFEVVTFITEDLNGDVWIGALTSGLTRYNPETQKVSRYRNVNDYGYFDGTTWYAFVSRDGVLWISDQPKLYSVDLSRKIVEHINVPVQPEKSPNTSRFFEDADGSLWLGSDEGLVHLDNSGRLIKTIRVKFSETENVRVSDLWSEGPDTLWLGTAKGVYKMNLRTEQYTKIDLGFNPAVLDIAEDKNGFKWIATTEGGLLKFDGKTVVKRYRTDKSDSTSISDEFLIKIQDDGNFLWVASGIGINRLDKQTDKFKHYLTEVKVVDSFTDKSGQFWAGTAAGLFRYDRVSDSFKPAGFHSIVATERTYGMAEDEHTNFWLATPAQVVRIDSARQVVTQLGAANGIAGNITPGSMYLTRHGELLVGSNQGYYHLNTQDTTFSENPPKLLITKFEVNNVNIPQHTSLENFEKQNAVVLDHNQNNISIAVAIIDFRDPGGNEFYSMLEGFDNEWREVGDNTSRFFSIPPGNYTFRLRAYVSSGAMAEKTIAITIDPPWWRTWWAYGGYSLIIIGLLVGARRLVVHQERLKSNLQLEHIELEKAKEIDKVKTTFFANISHEFRTPLTLIKGPVQELMERCSNDPTIMQKLKLIQRNSDLLLKLINQLLDLARLEAGSLKLEKSDGDIYAFLRAIVNSFESFANQKGVSLSVEVPVISKAAVFDKGKFETVLINLINNAIKFTPAGGSVHVKARADDKSMFVSVKDSGIGISNNDQQKVFERFHQVSEAHKEVGTGIGLSLVKELVAFMNGTIEVSSELGHGSEFRVTLPIELSSAQNTEISVNAEIIQSSAMTNGVEKSYIEQRQVQPEDGNGQMKSTILVVEDNSDLRSFIIDSLGKEFSFLEAENGALGLNQALDAVPNLIISDVMMPEMDGITMAQKIKKDIRTSHIPLILLTAKSTEESKLQGLASGADDYLTKPFNKNELALKVRNAINRQVKLREKLRAELLSNAPTVEVMSEDEKFLNKVKEQILERLSDEQLGVESLGLDIGLSRSQLFRKINALTGMSVNELIRKLRLQRADQLISQNWGPVAQVAYEVGFSNPSYFSKCFKEEFGVLPSERYERKGVEKH